METLAATEESSISLLLNGLAKQHNPTFLPQITPMPGLNFRLAAPDFVATPPYVLYAAKDDTYDDRAISLVYLAEGAANSVYRIRPWTPETKADQHKFIFLDRARARALCREHFVGKLIRISKGNAKTVSGLKIKKAYETDIRPMFEGGFERHLMDMETVVVCDELPEKSGEKKKKEEGRVQMMSSPHVGLLMEDMSSCAKKCITIEIKPKWLVQSPNAPRNAHRCRTCAIQAQRVSAGNKKKEGYLCPLQLLHGNVELVKPYLHHKVMKEITRFPEDAPDVPDDYVAQVLSEYLTQGEGNRLLHHLSSLQARLDKSGILDASWPSTNPLGHAPNNTHSDSLHNFLPPSNSNSTTTTTDTILDPSTSPITTLHPISELGGYNTESPEDSHIPQSHDAEMTLLHALLGTSPLPSPPLIPSFPIFSSPSAFPPSIFLHTHHHHTPSPTHTQTLSDLRLAMTLRDCSMFVRLTYTPGAFPPTTSKAETETETDSSITVEAKLADLDFKSADKFEDWAEKERGLVEGGWYEGEEDDGGKGCWVAAEVERVG
ncbi:hypothetical protein P154DRAFT_560898 [Amniculicola lignicola CBS 123094]|uniref:Inositol-pentakisphosphate 2-kinase n=1 Tax=Amniculicola lignicola CBS 123094 TaxID=1392246 RepID=A0A6A5WSP6_9PLEO|nr:hypothetical protein P154DRAFT_560898 [Amniculicola lignicola CBS 123094]